MLASFDHSRASISQDFENLIEGDGNGDMEQWHDTNSSRVRYCTYYDGADIVHALFVSKKVAEAD